MTEPMNETDIPHEWAGNRQTDDEPHYSMKVYRYTVTVTTTTEARAEQVMCERINVDEDYGFDYAIEWKEQVA